MSRRAPRCLAAGLAAVLVAAAPALGQQTEQELIQRLDTLVPLLKGAQHRAAAAQLAARRARDTHMDTDTVVVGLLTVLVVPGEGDAARDVVGGVWRRDYASWLDASPRLAADRVFFQWSADLVEFRSSAFNVRTVQGTRWQRRSYMEAGVRQVISLSLREDLIGTRFARDWGVFAVRPPEDPAQIYRQVVLAPSHAARACLAGEPAGCLAAFGLAPPDAPLSDQYSLQERRHLVQLNAARFFRGAPRELAMCTAGDLGECDGLLDDYLARHPSAEFRLWSVPFGPDVRASLLWYALTRGGAGAWGRLLAHADDEPVAALEAASGLDWNALLREWRAWVLQSRPVRQAGLGAHALTGAAWVLLLIALAARSTRWRFV